MDFLDQIHIERKKQNAQKQMYEEMEKSSIYS